MAKDPAVLWYYRDYLQGTEEMSWAEQGAYARLLNKQADKGHLTLQAIRKVLKKDFDKLWPGIEDKFLTDEQGNFYNDRMDIELQKRRKHSDKQSENAKKRWDKDGISDGNAMALPLANANASKENKNGMADVRTAGVAPDMLAQFRLFFPHYPQDVQKDFTACLSIAYRIAEANGWTKHEATNGKASDIVAQWGKIISFVAKDKWFKTRAIDDLDREWQRLMQAYAGTATDSKAGQKENTVADGISAARLKAQQA